MNNINNLTVGIRIALGLAAIGGTIRQFVDGDDSFGLGLVGTVTQIDGNDAEVVFDGGFAVWGNANALTAVPNDVVGVEGALYTKTPNGSGGFNLAPYTHVQPAVANAPQRGQSWVRTDTGGEYLVVDIEGLAEGDDTLRFVNKGTGEFYKLGSLFGRNGKALFVLTNAPVTAAPTPSANRVEEASAPVAPAPRDTPRAGQVWFRSDNRSYYLVVDTEDAGQSDTLRFLNVATGELYKKDSLFGRNGESRFSKSFDTAPEYAITGDLRSRRPVGWGVAPARGDRATRVKGGATRHYVIGNVESGADGGLRFFNARTGKVYSRSSLLGRKGAGKFTLLR